MSQVRKIGLILANDNVLLQHWALLPIIIFRIITKCRIKAVSVCCNT